jgi:hypothetical protein
MSCLDSFCSRDKKANNAYESPDGRNIHTGNSLKRNNIDTIKRESQFTEGTHERNNSIPTLHSVDSMNNSKLKITLNTKSINETKKCPSPNKFISIQKVGFKNKLEIDFSRKENTNYSHIGFRKKHS